MLLTRLKKSSAASVLAYFKELKYTSIETQLGGHGILVLFDSGKEGKTLLFRAELDGLPIQEETNLSYQSTITGKGHQCGHDEHLTMSSDG